MSKIQRKLQRIEREHRAAPGVIEFVVAAAADLYRLPVSHRTRQDVVAAERAAGKPARWVNYLPWVAAKARGAFRQEPFERQRRLNLLQRRTPSIIEWAMATRADLGPVSVEQALHEVSVWHAQLGATSRTLLHEDQGRILFRFPDGWTVQDLATHALLAREGEAMGHCVGSEGYIDEIRQGDARVLSLRTPDGQPRVTIHIQTPLQLPDGLYAPTRVLEIQGRGNTLPKIGYLDRVNHYFDRYFGDHALGSPSLPIDHRGIAGLLRLDASFRPSSAHWIENWGLDFAAGDLQVLGEVEDDPVYGESESDKRLSNRVYSEDGRIMGLQEIRVAFSASVPYSVLQEAFANMRKQLAVLILTPDVRRILPADAQHGRPGSHHFDFIEEFIRSYGYINAVIEEQIYPRMASLVPGFRSTRPTHNQDVFEWRGTWTGPGAGRRAVTALRELQIAVRRVFDQMIAEASDPKVPWVDRLQGNLLKKISYQARRF